MGGRSSWVSEATWRPLPRREYSTRQRSDYQVLLATNRHSLTPDGWVHEQDNQKLVLNEDGQPERVLVHETGINRYVRVEDVDFAAGRDYWAATSGFWKDVRDQWTAALQPAGRNRIATMVEGRPLHVALFAIAEEVRAAGAVQDHHRQHMAEVIAASLTTEDHASARDTPGVQAISRRP